MKKDGISNSARLSTALATLRYENNHTTTPHTDLAAGAQWRALRQLVSGRISCGARVCVSVCACAWARATMRQRKENKERRRMRYVRVHMRMARAGVCVCVCVRMDASGNVKK